LKKLIKKNKNAGGLQILFEISEVCSFQFLLLREGGGKEKFQKSVTQF